MLIAPTLEKSEYLIQGKVGVLLYRCMEKCVTKSGMTEKKVNGTIEGDEFMVYHVPGSEKV